MQGPVAREACGRGAVLLGGTAAAVLGVWCGGPTHFRGRLVINACLCICAMYVFVLPVCCYCFVGLCFGFSPSSSSYLCVVRVVSGEGPFPAWGGLGGGYARRPVRYRLVRRPVQVNIYICNVSSSTPCMQGLSTFFLACVAFVCFKGSTIF